MAAFLAAQPGAAALADVALVDLLVQESHRQLDLAGLAGLGTAGDATDATLDETIEAIERLTAQIGLVTHLLGLVQEIGDGPGVPRRLDAAEERRPELLDLLAAGEAAALSVLAQGARHLARVAPPVAPWSRP